MNFLESIAEIFARREDLRDICFVFPNRRSSAFFGRYLGLSAGRPVFLPRMVTIDSLFEELSGLHKADPIESLYILYNSYVEVRKNLKADDVPESFDEFVYWGDILLRDFDDIDKYLADADKLLLNIKQLKDLSIDYDFLSDDQKQAIAAFCENFNPDDIKESPDDKKRLFNETWNILQPLYKAFRAKLESEGKAYPGMMYRRVAEFSDLGSKLREKFSEIVFVGLSALNECEKELLSAAQKEGIGDFYWDFYGEKVRDPENKSSLFVCENARKFPSRLALKDIEESKNQQIEVIKVPSSVGQTRVVKQILDDLEEDGSLEDPVDTAIVLPDESLLFPMLGAIPPYIGKVNVTMGYSLGASSVESLFGCIERLHTDFRPGRGFYHKDVVELLEHPLIKTLNLSEESGKLRDEIIGRNIVFVSPEKAGGRAESFKILFREVSGVREIIDYQLNLINHIQSFQSGIDREFLWYYYKAIERIYGLPLDFDTMVPRTYYKLLHQCTSLLSIPFSGEPLSGLQIMGPLETRALDFKNVIMLSVSEGSFPSKSVSASFIPYNLRRGFGLPTYEYQDSIWAYHFYRSICRAERVFLIYDSRTEGMQSGEESRYIKQLKYHYDLPVVEKTVSYNLDSSAVGQIQMSVEKDKSVLNIKHFSASSLNCYLDCPLKFHYQYVKQIKEQDEVAEELDAGLFGSVYHAVMEHLYNPYVGEDISSRLLKRLRADGTAIDKLITEAFAKEAGITEIAGQNLILQQLIKRYVERTLEVDENISPFVLVGTEKDSSADIPLSGGRTAHLYGKIDRLDSNRQGIVRVVDYKTGSVKGKDDCSDVDKIFDAPSDKRPSVAFQLYLYALMEDKRHISTYSLRSIFEDIPDTKLIDDEKLDQFKVRLTALIEEILDLSRPFTGREENDKVCEYCNFKRLCRRQ